MELLLSFLSCCGILWTWTLVTACVSIVLRWDLLQNFTTTCAVGKAGRILLQSGVTVDDDMEDLLRLTDRLRHCPRREGCCSFTKLLSCVRRQQRLRVGH